MLHVAPEKGLAKRFQEAPNLDYLSADLDPERAMVAMDLTDIQYPDDTFDVIYCSHVVEHIPDDRRALRELYRVLKPGGWAMIHAPILRETTFEDASVTSPEERTRVFGQWDHVRSYGEDYVDRLREAGFEVSVERFIDSFSDEEVERLGRHASPRTADSYVYFSRKPANTDPAQAVNQ
jgi:ubiquinone/menaquinone biosynthesis C-methylase UbiE